MHLSPPKTHTVPLPSIWDILILNTWSRLILKMYPLFIWNLNIQDIRYKIINYLKQHI